MFSSCSFCTNNIPSLKMEILLLSVCYSTILIVLLVHSSRANLVSVDQNEKSQNVAANVNIKGLKKLEPISIAEYEELKLGSKRYEESKDIRPPYSYPQLILQALLDAPKPLLSVSQIFSFITNKYAYYKHRDDEVTSASWKGKIRFLLSGGTSYVRFIRSEPQKDSQPKNKRGRKGGFWTFPPECNDTVYAEAYAIRPIRHYD